MFFLSIKKHKAIKSGATTRFLQCCAVCCWWCASIPCFASIFVFSSQFVIRDVCCLCFGIFIFFKKSCPVSCLVIIKSCPFLFLSYPSLRCHSLPKKISCVRSVVDKDGLADPVLLLTFATQRTCPLTSAVSKMNFDQVKDYLQGRGEPALAKEMGGMSLLEMKNKFGDNEMELKRLQKELVQKRQREMADDIRQLKVQQEKSRTKKNQNDLEVAHLIKELQLRKQEEMEMELRKVKIQRELKQVDQKVLVGMEQEGKKTLDQLQRAKAEIARKEKEALDKIEAMTKEVAEQEKKHRDLEEERKEKLGRQKMENDKNVKDVKIQARLNKASEHGERMAALKRDRADLLSQRENVEQSFAKLPASAHSSNGGLATIDALEDMVSAHKVEAQVCRRLRILSSVYSPRPPPSPPTPSSHPPIVPRLRHIVPHARKAG